MHCLEYADHCTETGHNNSVCTRYRPAAFISISSLALTPQRKKDPNVGDKRHALISSVVNVEGEDEGGRNYKSQHSQVTIMLMSTLNAC